MNRFERALAFVAPRWGMQRAALLALRSHYDAARRDRRTAGWNARVTPPNSADGSALSLIRARSHDLVRNNAHAAAAVRKLATHMVGTGIIARFGTRDKVVRQAAADVWNAFVEKADPQGQVDFYGQQHLAARTIVESGEVLLRWHFRPSSWNLPVPLQCELLEPDFLDTGKNERLNDNAYVVQGVEFDRGGRRTAYWLFREHPADRSLTTRSWISERVPADLISHAFRVDRPGQVRGVPWLAPVMLRLRDIDDYEEAELLRKKIEACLTVFVTRPDAEGVTPSPAGSPSGLGDARTEEGRQLEKISPGAIVNLADGEDIKTATPQPSEGYGEYLSSQLHAAAVGLGPTYEMLTGDLRQVNFSSMREGKLDFWGALDSWQWHMLIPQTCRPAWSNVGKAAALTGKSIPYAVWSTPKRHWVDPGKDVEAAVTEVRAGLQTMPGAISARGYDPYELLDEMREWQEALDAAGVTLDSDPRRPAKGGAAVPPVKDDTQAPPPR